MKAVFFESLPYSSDFRVGSHHYASRFAEAGWDLMWVSHPLSPLHFLHPTKRDWDERVAGWRQGPLERDGVLYYSPFTLLPTGPQPGLRSAVVAHNSVRATVPSVRSVLGSSGFDAPDLAWLTNPLFEPLISVLRPRCVAMRVADDYTGFNNVPRSMAELEDRGLSRADIIFAVALGTHERLAQRFENVVLLPNGVDFEHFSAPSVEPEDLRPIGGPRVLYVGALEYWFDVSLVAESARRMPDASFVLIGPATTDVSALAAVPNVHLLGPRRYADLPGYLQHCDAGIIPFVRDEMVDSIHPIKVYEYLAAGLPVLAVRWTELERMGAPVRLTEPGGFAADLEDLLGEDPLPGREQRLAYARSNSWQSRYETVISEVQAVLARGTVGPK